MYCRFSGSRRRARAVSPSCPSLVQKKSPPAEVSFRKVSTCSEEFLGARDVRVGGEKVHCRSNTNRYSSSSFLSFLKIAVNDSVLPSSETDFLPCATTRPSVLSVHSTVRASTGVSE